MIFNHPFMLVFTLIPLCFCATTAAVLNGSETDKATLLILKAALGGHASKLLQSWNESSHFCRWSGVTCGRRHRRIVSLDLHGQGLLGTLSPHIGNLTFLRVINLEDNRVRGQIPPQIGRLSRLQHLVLNHNSLEGEVPTNLSRCSNLRSLGLSNNQLVGQLPEVLTGLTNLVVMNLSANNLSGRIPESIGNLSSLEFLSLSSNNLEGGLPSSLGRIKGLKGLYLVSNLLSGTLSRSIYNLSSLEVVDLSQNQLQGTLPLDTGVLWPNLAALALRSNHFSGTIPTSLSNCSRLETLRLSNNNFSGSVPTDLGKLQRLQSLGLAQNQLGGGDDDLSFIYSLTNCTGLRNLELLDNNLSGYIPGSISNLSSSLRWLSLGSQFRENAAIFGEIPRGIGNLVDLEFLFLQGSSLTGSIPHDLGKLPKLQKLILSVNRLSGRIPNSLCNSGSLITLFLSGNSLEGEIPSSIGKCTNLLDMNIGGNKLNGTVPNEVFNIFSLSKLLRLSSNSLSGPLPPDIGKLKHLRSFMAEDNQLSGELPSTIESCQSLEVLYLSNNSFTGSIPPEFKNVKGIQRLDLSLNNLSGQIPEFMENFTLKLLNLSFNHFEGEVPNGRIFRNSSAVSVIGNDKLCGGPKNLNLSPCLEGIVHSRKAALLRIAIPLICSSFIFLMLVFITLTISWKRWWKKKEGSSPSELMGAHLKLSYKDLFKATNGFSSDNLIGSGKYGFVYKGELEGRLAIAVKVLNLHVQGASTSFMAECDALRNIRHRNLIKIITACSSIDYKGNDFKALVFELMPNGSLDKWLHLSNKEGHELKNLNLLQRLNVAINVASALDYLHNHCQVPIVHCDLKPSNVLLDDDLVAHVADFGLARLLDKVANNFDQELSRSIAVKGTVG